MSFYPEGLNVRPLTTWPGELTRASARQSSPFASTLGSTLGKMDVELRALHALGGAVLEVAIPAEHFRIDGRPRAHAVAEHPGVVLSLPKTSQGPLRYATDKFTTWQDNLRAIVLGLEALRKVERYGITKRGEQYAGFRALPATASADMPVTVAATIVADYAANGYEASGVALDEQVARAAFKVARANVHPDRLGERGPWDMLERAGRALGLVS